MFRFNNYIESDQQQLKDAVSTMPEKILSFIEIIGAKLGLKFFSFLFDDISDMKFVPQRTVNIESVPRSLQQ